MVRSELQDQGPAIFIRPELQDQVPENIVWFAFREGHCIQAEIYFSLSDTIHSIASIMASAAAS